MGIKDGYQPLSRDFEIRENVGQVTDATGHSPSVKTNFGLPSKLPA
jgi:hypothetical protein